MQRPAHGTLTIAESSYGRLKLFDNLAAANHSDSMLTNLAAQMIGPEGDVAKDGSDDEENPYVPAGYTYLGQFVDHDLTFDTLSVFDDPLSFEHASNLRTPRFDLDNIYGRGPDDQPYLYKDPFDGTLLLGEPLANGVPDVLRNRDGRAIIGDPRNDENSIVVQVQSAFIRFHNRMIQRANAGVDGKKLSGTDAFLWAQTQTRRHYQRILLDDFLPRVIDPTHSTVSSIFSDLQLGRAPKLKLYDLDRSAYIPVEFGVAAYRFGHSMIRPGYRLSVADNVEPLTPGLTGPDNISLFNVFEGDVGGLRGFQRLSPNKAINWSLFFFKGLAAGSQLANDNGSSNNQKGLRRTQLSYKIDTMLVHPLGILPKAVSGDPSAANPSSLPERNLRRGREFGLPSGQDAAARVGAPILPDERLSVRGDGSFSLGQRKTLTSIDPGFAGNAPLWFYILAEAEQGVIDGLASGPSKEPLDLGTRLGPLGSAIVLETFVGLMLKDSESVLNPRAAWRSINGKPTFSMEELFAEIETPLD